VSYRTAFAIRVIGGLRQAPLPIDLDDICLDLNELSRVSFYITDPHHSEWHQPRYAKTMPPGRFIYCSATGRWDDHEEHLDRVSKVYPTVRLYVLGLGEDALFGDVWIQLFEAGSHSQKQYIGPMMHVYTEGDET
jgi:hypothetical protein